MSVGAEDEAAPGAWNARAELAQRNKQSLAVDLASERGRDARPATSVAKADVVRHRPAARALAALGLDYATLAARQART